MHARLALLTLALASHPSGAQGPSADIRSWLEQLTLEEKARLVTGRNAWETAAVERLGIPATWLADGPVGVRRSVGTGLGLESEPATLFPSAAAVAATWNPMLVERMGAAIGAEARSQGVTLLLAPGLNLKRHPLGGRNFEYYSEDPLLSGLMAAAFVRGVQSQGVGATLKHFAVNNQETRRMTIDARVDERTLRELYLRGFEIAVRESAPQAVMSAYNRVNGTHASQSETLLTGILRQEWGFEGLVVSDWGAVDDAVASLEAGLDLEMPGNGATPAAVVGAVRSGRLDAAVLDRSVARVLQLAHRRLAVESSGGGGPAADAHDIAREVAIEGMVLLKNDGILPLSGAGRVGVIGRLAVEPRLQGIGSSQVNVRQPESPWSELEKAGPTHDLEIALWSDATAEDGLDPSERETLGHFASGSDVLIIFAGQRASHDAEAWDRPSSDLSPTDLETIEVVKDSGKPFVVVVTAGGVVDLRPFVDDASAILFTWLGGEAFGSAVSQVLLGERSPSGKLSETFAWRVDDHPSALHFPGGPSYVSHGEGAFVGYRYFQSFDRPVAFPFGHGLTYGRFELSGATVSDRVTAPGLIELSFELANTGARRAAQTVQVYAQALDPSLPRPALELVAFSKVELDPGDRRTVELPFSTDRLAYYHDGHRRWVTEAGDYRLVLGFSATDARASLPVRLVGGTLPDPVFTADDTLGDLYATPQGRAVLDLLLVRLGRQPLSQAREDDFFAAVLRNLPFKKLQLFSGGQLSAAALDELLELINSDLTRDEIERALERADR